VDTCLSASSTQNGECQLTVKSSSKGILGRGEDHLVSNVGIIGGPGHQYLNLIYLKSSSTSSTAITPVPRPSAKKMKRNLPHDKAQLVPNTLSTWKSVLEIVNRPSTFLLRQFTNKGVKVLLLRSLEDDNGSLVLGQTVDDVRELLAGLQLGEFVEALGALGRSRSGIGRKYDAVDSRMRSMNGGMGQMYC
jgi:hypothetical protein